MKPNVTVTQVFRSGEKVAGQWASRGRKPLGYNVYIDDVIRVFIPRARLGADCEFRFYKGGTTITQKVHLSK